MKILLTGGTGYIGSHISVELLNQGHEIIIVDNLCNSSPSIPCKIKRLTNKSFDFYAINILDYAQLEKVFVKHKIDAVIHLAGYKSIGESIKEPLKYYNNNFMGSVNILRLMQKYKINKLIFSSTATVYKEDNKLPITEKSEIGTNNPYSLSKLMIENMIRDICEINKDFSAVILRYFNPIGAHPSGLIGESPSGIPNNLMPYLVKVACGEISHLSIFGNDYPTKDGTAIRDYIHILDLVDGHLLSLNKLTDSGLHIYNLGLGKGYSVLDIVNTFEKTNNIKINYDIIERRLGDMAIFYSNASKAKKELGWKPKYNLKDMCKDSWNFGNKSMTDWRNNDK